jgi:ribosomal protein L11 methyltransferase
MKKFLKIEIEISSAEDAEILIADLSEIGFYAFEQEENCLFSYIKEADFKEAKLREVLPGNKGFGKTIIAEENWNQQWESDFQPVVINDFAAIRAHFHQPVKNVRHDIIITPKMSFGTGHHATTFLMIELMQQIDFKNKTVLDFGTGTGVLAILAEKLGAIDVLAIDNDIWSINNAKENTEMNHCKNTVPEQRDDLEGIAPVDVLLANINLNVLTHASAGISNSVKKGGWFLCSGFLTKDEEAMDTFFKNNFEKKLVSGREGWLSILFQKVT